MSDTAGITLSMTGGARRKGGQPSHAPVLIVALECSRPRALSARHELAGISVVKIGRGRERSSERIGEAGGELNVRVPDRWMSSSHAQLEHSFGRWVLRDTGSKNGTVLNGEPVQRAVLGDGDLFELGHTLFLFREAAVVMPGDPLDLDLDAQAPPAPGLGTLVAEFGSALGKLEQVAGSSIPVLLSGESGTGKEVLARAVHALSGRKGDFVAVNCGAIPANLVESELFGHRRGSFSGALEDRQGLVRSAHGGTLFLDEIGDLPAASQAALLRVLQEREVLPVGGTKPIAVDLRVVSATHRDLDAMVARGGFRQDLFARISGYRLGLPPLRERRADLGLLIGSLYAKAVGDRPHPGFEPDAVRSLFDHAWPLNIRELEQTLATAAVLAGDAAIGREHLPEHVRDGHHAGASSDLDSTCRPLTADDLRRRDDLLGQLREHRGNVSAIARAMGKDRKQIQRWIKRYGLSASDFRS